MIKAGTDSVVARLDLSGEPEALRVLSGRERTVRALDELRSRVGDAPARWLPILLGEKRLEDGGSPRPAARMAAGGGR